MKKLSTTIPTALVAGLLSYFAGYFYQNPKYDISLGLLAKRDLKVTEYSAMDTATTNATASSRRELGPSVIRSLFADVEVPGMHLGYLERR